MRREEVGGERERETKRGKEHRGEGYVRVFRLAFISVRYARVTTRFNRAATNSRSVCMDALKTRTESIS